MPGLTDITASYLSGVDASLASEDTVNEAFVLRELKKDDLSNQAALESAFRQSFYKTLAKYTIDNAEFAVMWRLLDVVNTASDVELCEPGLPFLLIEELLDSQTIHGCRRVFDYLESRRERMIAKHWKYKHLVILRSCNELLRRLSRAEDTVFCGRVFIFLFQSFPLGDKSSVNLRGEYHTDNVTQFDQALSSANNDSMEVDEGEADKETAQSPPMIIVEGKDTIDTDKLYPTFWALQEYFAQPTKLFDSAQLASFKDGLQITLKKFKEVYREEPRSASRQVEDGADVRRKPDKVEGDNFNPRYLTSRDLFELEIHDPEFRRYILVQALIAVDFLLSQTAKSKSKLENLKNRSLIYEFVLDDKDAGWATSMRNDIASYLQQGSEGKFYYRMVDTVLSRDKNWLRWKGESCPPFQLEPVTANKFVEARDGIQRAAAPRYVRKAPMTALDISFLEERPTDYDPTDRFRDANRWRKPDLDSFRDPVMDATSDLEAAQTDEEKLAASEARSMHAWRALRVGARFSMLDKLDDSNNLDPLFEIQAERAGEETDQEPLEAEQINVSIDGTSVEQGTGDGIQADDDAMAENGEDGPAAEQQDDVEGQRAGREEAPAILDEDDEDEEMGAEQVNLIGDGAEISSPEADAT